MGIKFKSPLALSAHRAIAHSDSAQTLEVKVVVKTAAHPEFGNGSANGYTIDGVEGAYLEFTPGNTYKFDQSDSSNTGHPLRFYEDAAKTVAYTTGVTTSGTPGTAGAYTQIVPTTSTNPILYYQCSAHSLMGSYVKFGTGSLGGEADSAIKILLTVKNVSGGTLNAGTLVRVAPTSNPPSGNVLEVDVADNSAASTMPAVGILSATITNGAEGNAVAFGRAAGFSTSGYTEGDPIWVGTSGAFTGTKPTGTALIQRVGQIIKVHASNGSIEIFGAGRSNDVPNIPQDQVWLGNSNSVATPTDHTVENISNVTVSSKTDGQALVWDATNSYWKNGTVSGGGGGGTVTVEKNVYTANGSTATFNTSTAIVNENNVQVYIDGVYQSKDNYTTSGSTVTMSTAPPNTTSVELIHMVAVDGVIARDSFTGNGSTTAYVLSMSISNENATQVYIDGVYQSKDNYTTSGSTLTFSTAPPNGAAVEVVHIKAVAASTLNQNNFTGDGSTTAFTLSQTVTDETNTFVFIQGVYQEKSVYSINGTTLTFTTAPQNGYTVEVMAFGTITVGNQTVTSINGQTGAVTLETGIDWQSTIQTSNFTAAAGKGYFVNTTSAAITVTLPSSPSAGDELTIVDYAGTADTNSIVITSSNNINGAADDVKINYERGGVSIVYVDATQGWIAYNAANETATALLPNIPLTVDYLVVAGGGGGGAAAAGSGGGGAGGLLTSFGSYSGGGAAAGTSLSLSESTNYTVTIGSGGAGGTGTAYGNNGTQGQNSTFSTITSTGGGFGSSNNVTGGTGGSGGGGCGGYNTGGGAATSSPVQGYAGGDANGSVSPERYSAGGGGGAGVAGGNGNVSSGNEVSGDGGNGLEVNIIGGTGNYYAGGGGGGAGYVGTPYPGAGGTGGGGAGGAGGSGTSTATNGSNGTTNTGGGGGGGAGHSGAQTNTNGGTGGSGVVILRYPNAYTITIGAGLTGSTATDGSDKVTSFTAGTGNIQFN